MEIDKKELLFVMREFWALKNNEVCEQVTVTFMRRQGFTDKEMRFALDIHPTEDQELQGYKPLQGYIEDLEHASHYMPCSPKSGE